MTQQKLEMLRNNMSYEEANKNGFYEIDRKDYTNYTRIKMLNSITNQITYIFE